MNPVIEFCMSNLAGGSYKAMERLKKDRDLDVVEHVCLRYCGLCYEGPYALVNGEFISGKTADELVDNIYEYLEENEGF